MERGWSMWGQLAHTAVRACCIPNVDVEGAVGAEPSRLLRGASAIPYDKLRERHRRDRESDSSEEETV